MQVLVTGATGFVGRAVTLALIKAGHDVTGFVRSAKSGSDLKEAGARLAVGDMRKPADYVPLVSQADAVIHAAQLEFTGKFTDQKAAELRAADHTMLTALAAECLSNHKRLLYTGCAFSYGDHGDKWITETTPFSPSPLGVAHAAGIKRIRQWVSEGLDAVVLSPGFIYGPGGQFESAFYDQVREGRLRVIGMGQNYWSVIHVDDLASAYVAALENAPAGAEYNVVDGSPTTLRAFADAVTDGMGKPRVGVIPLMIISMFIGRPLVDSLVTSFRIDNKKIRTELGWEPRFSDFTEGMPSTLETLKERR
jgi:nucleoside-diphosphate-sugar epimerase